MIYDNAKSSSKYRQMLEYNTIIIIYSNSNQQPS